MKNSFWTLIEYIWFPFLTIITTPFFIGYLGLEKFGYWIFLLTIIATTGLFLGGNTAAILKRIISKKENLLYFTSIIIILINSIILSLIFIIVLGCWSESFFPELKDNELIRLIIFMMPLFFFFEMLDNSLSVFLKGMNYFKKNTLIELKCRSLQVILIWLYLSNGGESLKIIFTVMILMTILKIILKIRVLGIRIETRGFKIEVKKFMSIAKWGYLQGGTGLVFTVLDKLIVAAYFGPKIMTLYSISIQLASQIHAITAAGYSAIQPKLINEFHENKKILNKNLIQIKNFIISLILSIACITFSYYYLNEIDFDIPKKDVIEVFLLICLSFFILSLNVTSYYILVAQNRLKQAAKISLFASSILIVTLILNYPFNDINDIVDSRIYYSLFTLILIPMVWKYDKIKNI